MVAAKACVPVLLTLAVLSYTQAAHTIPFLKRGVCYCQHGSLIRVLLVANIPADTAKM